MSESEGHDMDRKEFKRRMGSKIDKIEEEIRHLTDLVERLREIGETGRLDRGYLGSAEHVGDELLGLRSFYDPSDENDQEGIR